MHMNKIQEEKNTCRCIVAAARILICLFVVVACAEMLDMVDASLIRHEAVVNE